MYLDIYKIFEQENFLIKTQEKAKIFHAIFKKNKTSRKEIYKELGLRPTSVSSAVNQLIEEGFVFQVEQKKEGKRGRTENWLFPNKDRLSAISIRIDSRKIIASVVNLGEEIIGETVQFIPYNTTNKEFVKIITQQLHTIMDVIPDDSELLGAGISLPGIIDQQAKKWIFNSRWLNIRGIDFTILEKKFDITIYLCRMLDAELLTILKKNPVFQEDEVLLVHWGFGIGTAYGHKGIVLHSKAGNFGEVGHIKVVSHKTKRTPNDEIQIIESIASGRALLPVIRNSIQNIPDDEHDLYHFCRIQAIDTIPEVVEAIDTLSEGLSVLYRIFFPKIVLVYGPFIQNDKIYSRLQQRYTEKLPLYSDKNTRIQRLSPDIEKGEVFGSTYHFFKNTLKELLNSR